MTKLVVFDVDGTILDSISFFEDVINDYSKRNNLQIPCFQSLKQGYHDPVNHDFKWGVSREEQRKHLHAAWQEVDDALAAGKEGFTPDLFHGVEEALRRLKDDGHTLAVVTMKSEAPLLQLFEHHDIGNLFSAWRVYDDVARRGEKEKPAPDMLLGVMRELDFAPDETVMIGDTTMDVLMGRNAKTHTIGVSWGAHPRQHLVDAGAHHVLDNDFVEIVPVIKKIFG